MALKNPKFVIPTLFGLPILSCFLAIQNIPMVVDSDNGLMISALEQYHSKKISQIHTFKGVSPYDLSENVNVWISWYTPGVSLLFYPAKYLPFSLGDSIRLLGLCYYLVGLWGWFSIWKYLKGHVFSLWMMVFTGFVYYQRIGGLLYLHADVLPFCIFPWLLLWGLNLINYCHKCTGISFMDSLQLHTRSITFGLSCGLVYWLKYSGFISIAALLTGVCLWILIKCKNFSLQKRIFVCSSISTALLPVILLNLVNLNFSGVYSLADEANTAGFNQDTVGFIDLFFSIIVGPGLSLFNFHSIAQHFFCFMDPTFPFLKKFGDFSDRIVWMPLLAIPLISFFYYLFWKSKRHFSTQTYWLATNIWIITFSLMGFMSWYIGCHYINMGVRYTSVFIFLFHLIITETLINEFHHYKRYTKVFVYFCVFIFVITPGIFESFRSFRGMFFDSKLVTYKSSEKNLYFHYLAKDNLKEVIEEVDSLTLRPNDIVAVAHNWETTNFGAWIEFSNKRILPLCSVDDALKHVYHGKANCFSKSPFNSSENLRVILVLSQEFLNVEDDMLQIIKSRFPQATEWHTTHKSLKKNRAQIWYTDLKV